MASGFDWLSLPVNKTGEQSHTPPPPQVSFGISASSSEDRISGGTPDGVTQGGSNIDFKTLFRDFSDPATVGKQLGGPGGTFGGDRPASSGEVGGLGIRTGGSTAARPGLGTTESAPAGISITPFAANGASSKDTTQQQDSARHDEEILSKFKDDTTIPLSLTIEQLTTKEAKTYLRWYNDIITRRGTRTITLDDVFKFLYNFKIQPLHRKLIQKIFASCSQSLNVGQFFCVLRIISHAVVYSTLPSRHLIEKASPIPTPVSILARKRMKDSEDEPLDEDNDNDLNHDMASQDSRLNLDTFAQFMLTGQRPDSSTNLLRKKKKKLKTVKFSETVEIDPRSAELPPLPLPPPESSDKLDFSLPMEQLLGKITPKSGVTLAQLQTENEEEELKDMQESISHFQNVNIDSVSIDGVPSNIPSNYFSSSPLGAVSPLREESSSPQLLQPNLTGSVSKSMRQGLTSPLPPPSRIRSVSSPVPFQDQNQLTVNQQITSPRVSSPLSNNTTGTSINWTTATAVSPPPPPPRRYRSSTLPGQHSVSPVPPPPPPSRSRKNSNPPAPSAQGATNPALPPKIEINQSYGFDDYFKNGNVYKSNSDLSINSIQQEKQQANVTTAGSSDILGDLRALQLEVERIKYLNGTNGY